MSLVDALAEWSGDADSDLAWLSMRDALAAAGDVLADQAAEDVEVLRAAGPAATVASVGEQHFLTLALLPARFQVCYDTDFAVRWGITVQEVADRVAGAWQMPISLAEALACLLVLDQAETELELRGLTPPEGWREEAEELIVPDSDVSILLDSGLDGADESDIGRAMGLPSFRPVDWFDPFGAATG